MSTRGFISFAVKGETKTAYNHSDSYPGGLGSDVLDWLRTADLDAAAVAAQSLRVVTDADEPTAEDIARLAPWTNRSVGRQGEAPEWYQLLRGTQGDPGAMLTAGVIRDASGFPADSLFAEWGYVVDFGAQTFEVYGGFQHGAHAEGRFASPTPNDGGYYPVRLIASWPPASLPTGDAFLAAAQQDEAGAPDA